MNAELRQALYAAFKRGIGWKLSNPTSTSFHDAAAAYANEETGAVAKRLGRVVDVFPHIDVQSLEGAKQSGCSHCDVRYEYMAQDHVATWLVQWMPAEHETCAWLTCDAGLVHALRLIHRHRTMGEFLQAVKRGEGTEPVLKSKYEPPAIESTEPFALEADIDELARKGSS